MATTTTHHVLVPPTKPFLQQLKKDLKETLCPDDPLKQFKHKNIRQKFYLILLYIFAMFNWIRHYDLALFRADVVAGITIASLAVPQGISYASLAGLPAVMGLYSSFIPPLVYAMMGSSRELAVGPIAAGSLLLSSMLRENKVDTQSPLYIGLVLTATFFAGVFQASLGILRLGIVLELLTHATIVGFMSGAATVVCLQQLKGILGLLHFPQHTSIVSVLDFVFKHTHEWRWETVVMGCGFLFLITLAKYFRKRNTVLYWINTMTPLAAVILGGIMVFFSHADKHGIPVIGEVEKGLHLSSLSKLTFGSHHLRLTIKTGIITGIIGLTEGIAVAKNFAVKNYYNIDGNKEMTAFGVMNIVGSCTSCFLTAGPFSRTAVNYNAGCKTALSNAVMATVMLVTLLYLTPYIYYVPQVVLSSILLSAMVGVIDYKGFIEFWKLDKFDFIICVSAYLGVLFKSAEFGLIISVMLSVIRMFLFVMRPNTSVLGNIPNSTVYQSVDHYPNATRVPGLLILHISGPIFAVNTDYLEKRIQRWIDMEEDGTQSSRLQYIILDLTGVGAIDTSGISMLSELDRTYKERNVKLVIVNPSAEVMTKLYISKFVEKLGEEWIFPTVAAAVTKCNSDVVEEAQL